MTENNVILLLLDRSAWACIPHFDRKDGGADMMQMEEQEKAKEGAVVSLLCGQ